ncbi:hypothetical protein ACA910_003616 [Epithemia clementina (nom. ined.)]
MPKKREQSLSPCDSPSPSLSSWSRNLLCSVLPIVFLSINNLNNSAFPSLQKQNEFRLMMKQWPNIAPKNGLMNRTKYGLKEEGPQEMRQNDDREETKVTSNKNNKTSHSELRNTQDFFSACLLIMDENHRLPEWLAFHYYMLPLRHVVLLVDPRSETSPMDIVHRWQPYVQIDVWNFADLPEYMHVHGNQNALKIHRFVQQHFYYECALHMQRLERTWVTFHDVDEYLQLNPDFFRRKQDYAEFISQPASFQRFLKQKEKNNTARPEQFEYKMQGLQNGCFVAARNYYGALEQDNWDRVQQDVPIYLNGTHFETLRWLHRTTDRDIGRNNGPGKSILRVYDGMRKKELNFTGFVHKVDRSCQDPPVSGNPFRLRHYLGSWDSYSSRFDCRIGTVRNREIFLFITDMTIKSETEDSVRPWLQGFCNQFDNNATVIQNLLLGTGQLPPKSDLVRNVSWSLQPGLLYENLVQYPLSKRPFTQWLQRRFNVTKLANGTIVVETIGGYGPYPYFP